MVAVGALDFTIEGRTRRLDSDPPGVIPPGVPHYVTCVGPVRFHVALYREATALVGSGSTIGA